MKFEFYSCSNGGLQVSSCICKFQACYIVQVCRTIRLCQVPHFVTRCLPMVGMFWYICQKGQWFFSDFLESMWTANLLNTKEISNTQRKNQANHFSFILSYISIYHSIIKTLMPLVRHLFWHPLCHECMSSVIYGISWNMTEAEWQLLDIASNF